MKTFFYLNIRSIYGYDIEVIILECKRLYKYDVLRSVCIFSIIILHLGSQYTYDSYQAFVKVTDYEIGFLCEMMTRAAVPCFVMLSGAFLIIPQNEEMGMFYKKMLKKLVVPGVVFSIIYVLYAYLQILIAKLLDLSVSIDMISPWKPIIKLIQGRPHAIMWYMYMIIGIYMITPIIVYIKKSINKRQFVILSLIMLAYGVIIHYSCEIVWPLWFIEWIGYFMLGTVIYEINQKKNNKLSGICQIMISTLLLLVNCFLGAKFRKSSFEFREAFNPFIIAAAVLFFSGFSCIDYKKERKLISEIGKNTMWIYLIHILCIDPVYQMSVRAFRFIPSSYIILPYGIIVLFICLKISKAINMIMGKSYGDIMEEGKRENYKRIYSKDDI